MKNTIALICFSIFAGFSSIQAQSVNTSNSKVSFAISNMKFRTVTGNFSGMKGMAKLNTSNLTNSSFDICIDASSINTENEKRDTHLKNEDFFNVEKYPEICFVSSSISKTAQGFEAKGKLTMHGVTKEVSIPFTYENKIVKGKLDINRLDYKIGEDFGSFMVGKEVEIWIEAHIN